jgi:hypothetical protein
MVGITVITQDPEKLGRIALRGTARITTTAPLTASSVAVSLRPSARTRSWPVGSEKNDVFGADIICRQPVVVIYVESGDFFDDPLVWVVGYLLVVQRAGLHTGNLLEKTGLSWCPEARLRVLSRLSPGGNRTPIVGPFARLVPFMVGERCPARSE